MSTKTQRAFYLSLLPEIARAILAAYDDEKLFVSTARISDIVAENRSEYPLLAATIIPKPKIPGKRDHSVHTIRAAASVCMTDLLNYRVWSGRSYQNRGKTFVRTRAQARSLRGKYGNLS